jgi:hypothetical protein
LISGVFWTISSPPLAWCNNNPSNHDECCRPHSLIPAKAPPEQEPCGWAHRTTNASIAPCMCISCAFDAHDRVGFLNSLAGFMQVLRPNASLTYWAHLSAITRPPCSCWYWLQDALVGCSDRVAPARASEKICGCESSPPRADRDTMQICRLATPLFALLAFQGFATSSRDRNRVNFPHTRAGTLPLATAGSRLTLDTCSDVPTTRQPARRSARSQCSHPLALRVSLSYLKLDGKRSTLPAYLGPIPYRQDHTRSDE